MRRVAIVTLNDGHSIPQLGLGVWQLGDHEAETVVGQAIDVGYRLIDTAAVYGNEEGVGRAIRSASVPRAELFVTTKLWNDRQGRDEALRACDESLERLGLDYVDSYLIHWPAPQRGAFVETWRAFAELKRSGRIRSVGVSNFTKATLQTLFDQTGLVPAINQVELHPRFQQKSLRAFHSQHGIATQAWAPLGRGAVLGHPAVEAIARKHGKTPAQIVLRWHMENSIIAIPKSATPARIRENIAVFNFSLDREDLDLIGALDDPAGRIGRDPETVF
jgi:2,5-diketo-D-gluconate reductase A